LTTFVPYLNINTQLIPPQTAGNTTKQVLLIGQRKTNGTLYLTKNGFTQPNYYVPIQLPGFSNGLSALQYLANYGIQYQLGFDFTLSLPAPTTVSTISGNTVLTWSTIPYGFNKLTNFALSGTLTQGSVNGTVQIANIISGVATLQIQGVVAYVTSANSGTSMTLVGVDNVQYPDPNNSDPIALMVWDFYESALSAYSSPNGAPTALISILSDEDNTISPSSSPKDLAVPNSVVINPDDSVSLNYTYTTLSSLINFGYLPTTALGTTNVTQTTSNATGTFGGFIISPNSSGGIVTILVTNVTGTFVTTTGNTIVVELDPTQNVFQFLNNIDLYGAVQQFPINAPTDVTTKYADFYNGINILNDANQVLNNHYLTYGIAGNITLLPSQVGAIGSPNNFEYIIPTYPYVQKFGDIPYDNDSNTVGSGRVSSAIAYMLANGDAPYPSLMNSVINHLPVSSISNTTSYTFDPTGTGQLAIMQGLLPLAPNSNNVVQFLQSNTTMITLPNTTVPDVEFRYTHIWDCVRSVKYNVAQLYKTISVLPNNQGSALISPQFLLQFRNGIISILYSLQNLNVVKNVALYENLVTVTQDTVNPNQVNATVPSQMIAQLNGASINILVFSSIYQFTNTTA